MKKQYIQDVKELSDHVDESSSTLLKIIALTDIAGIAISIFLNTKSIYYFFIALVAVVSNLFLDTLFSYNKLINGEASWPFNKTQGQVLILTFCSSTIFTLFGIGIIMTTI